MGILNKLLRKNQEIETKEGSAGNSIMAAQDPSVILKEQYGITVSAETSLLSNFPGKLFEIPTEQAHLFAPMAAALPTLIANRQSLKILNRQLYTVTKNGRDVHPSELAKKQNGSSMLNEKNPNSTKWGKQADLNPLDQSGVDKAKIMNIASSVFAVASVATQTYYLKEIDDKLSALQAGVDDILEFLEQDKKAKLAGDWNTLQTISRSVPQICDNQDTKALYIQTLAAIQREAKNNIIFYQSQIHAKADSYVAGKNEEQSIQSLQQAVQHYHFCLCEYALSRLIEIMLTNNYESTYLAIIRTELENMSRNYEDITNEVSSKVHNHYFERPETKFRAALSGTLQSLSDSSFVKFVGLSDAFEKLSVEGRSYIDNQRRFISAGVRTEDYNRVLEPFIQNVATMEAQTNGTVDLIYDNSNGHLFLKLPDSNT